MDKIIGFSRKTDNLLLSIHKKIVSKSWDDEQKKTFAQYNKIFTIRQKIFQKVLMLVKVTFRRKNSSFLAGPALTKKKLRVKLI